MSGSCWLLERAWSVYRAGEAENGTGGEQPLKVYPVGTYLHDEEGVMLPLRCRAWPERLSGGGALIQGAPA